MGPAVNVVFLTADDPLYLPTFFEEVLSARSDGVSVFVVPPLYKNQSAKDAAWRYLRTFGAGATVGLARRVVAARLQRRSIARVCESHGVPCAPARDVNDPEFLERLRGLETDVIVSVSCPQIFKKPLIDLPPRGCLNIHGAILPAYRGVMPSFWMLAHDEDEAGVSIFFVNHDIDGGDLCGQRVFAIESGDTLDTFLRRSKAIAADLLLDVLGSLENGGVTRTPLDVSNGSYYSWPDRPAVKEFRAAGRRVW
jgi:methionyl-tRNA formyltransferase